MTLEELQDILRDIVFMDLRFVAMPKGDGFLVQAGRGGGMKIFKEKPGVISEGPGWVCIDDGYLYTADTLLGLLWMLLTQWKDDRHMVG